MLSRYSKTNFEYTQLPPLKPSHTNPDNTKVEVTDTSFSMVIASGPFSPDADLLYKPWKSLLKTLKSQKPAVVLLVCSFSDNVPVLNLISSYRLGLSLIQITPNSNLVTSTRVLLRCSLPTSPKTYAISWKSLLIVLSLLSPVHETPSANTLHFRKAD